MDVVEVPHLVGLPAAWEHADCHGIPWYTPVLYTGLPPSTSYSLSLVEGEACPANSPAVLRSSSFVTPFLGVHSGLTGQAREQQIP